MITVEDYLKENVYITQDGIEDVHDSLSTVRDAVIGLIQLHVEAALKEAEIAGQNNWGNSKKMKDAILNSYLLENIK